MTNRRQFLLAGALGAIAPRAFAQARPVRVGMIGPIPLEKSVVYAPGVVRGLAALGYRDGTTMRLEYRYSENIAERYPKIARELLELKCDVIIAIGSDHPVRALQSAGSPIPIVFLAVDYDPVQQGVVSSLRKPDRNTTGLYVQQNAMVAKRVEIMREVLPAAQRFLIFADVFSRDQLDSARRAADAARVRLSVVEFSQPPYGYAGALEKAKKEGVEAVVTLASAPFAGDRVALAALFEKHRLPSVGSTFAQANAGFLLSFGADVSKVTRRVADIAARILKSTKPEAIPVELADEFELAINVKTARALGVKVPESVLARATRIVE